MKQIMVIPARIGSKRLKNKPMINLKGKTMIERTFLQCTKAFNKELIYVATDSKIILKHCKKKKIKCILTSKNCLTGTDRVAEVAKKIKVDSYINVQGDEPLFNPKDIKKLVKISKNYPDEILNGYCAISDKNLFRNINIPKVVFSKQNNLLYMSRAEIPGNKKSVFREAYRQVCAYVFPRSKLLAFKKNKKTKFENIEDIEILRFLELGFKVKMVKLSQISKSVDTKSDIKKILGLIN
jgi:3-deoxy-manno-octulosonate cytidylyltransferase (CMP-KDO synthetase)